jgi:tripartite-type tricarboxylate transporter receptor subunit TctC
MTTKHWAAALPILLCATAALAQAQNYPNRPVRVIVAAATGGPDITARIVMAELQKQMGQPFVVENQPGANGMVGANMVAKAAPDGYTLLVYSSGIAINPYAHKSMPYDTATAFTPITNLVSNGGLFFAVAQSVPAKSLKEFIDYAKKPGTHLAYSTPGVGNTWHLAMEVFDHMTGVKMTHIPYKGGGPATAALASGEVQAMFASPAPLMPHYKSGKVRVLAWTGEKRHPALPEVPTTAEAGLPQYKHDGGWFALFGPAGMPADITEKLWREVQKAEQTPEVLERFKKIGVFPVADSPADFARFFQNELKAYGEQAKLANLQPE